MVASCERCKRRDEQDYRELDDREKYFLMHMMGDFQHEMIIPEEFVQRLKSEIPGEIKLETRNGYSCTIGVSKDQEKLVLMVGWGQFVKNFDLQMGDYIIFRYNGNSQFNVIIFDNLGREKALSVAADAFLYREQERPTETTETVNRSQGHHQIIQMQSPTEAMDRFHVHHQPQMRPPPETVNHYHGHPQATEATETVKRSHGHHQRMQMQSPTEAMDRFHVHHQPQMRSPPETVNHSHGHPQTIQMQSRTETLTPSHVPPQPMQMQPSSKTVNFLPMQSPPTKRQRRLQRDTSSQVKRTTLISSSVSSGDSFSKEGHGVHSVPGHNYIVGQKKTLYSVQNKQLNDGYITTRGTKLTSIQEEQVKKKVQSFHTDIHIFVAVMCKVNVVSEFILGVPNFYSQNYLGYEQSVLLQRHGETWKVTFCGRSHGSLNDRRFKSGWQKFVQDNNLKMGDICLFERLNNQSCTL